jgi:hypothetical protein
MNVAGSQDAVHPTPADLPWDRFLHPYKNTVAKKATQNKACLNLLRIRHIVTRCVAENVRPAIESLRTRELWGTRLLGL